MTDNVFELDGVWYAKKSVSLNCDDCVARFDPLLCTQLPSCDPSLNNGNAISFYKVDGPPKVTLNISTAMLQAELETLQEQLRILQNDHILEIELLKADYEARITRLAQKMMKGKE